MHKKLSHYLKFISVELFILLLAPLKRCVLAQEDKTLTAPIPLPPITISGLINTIIQLVFGISVFVCVVFLVIYGIQYIMAGDDTKKITGARKGISGAVIGMCAVVLTFAIVKFVAVLLGADSNSILSIFPDTLILSTKAY